MDTVVASVTPDRTALRYRVGGMDCPSCAGKIETALRRLGGADGIRLNYHSQTLALRLDEAATPRETLEARIRSLGYEVSTLEGPTFALPADASAEDLAIKVPTAGSVWWQGGKARLLLAIGTLLAAGSVVRQLVPTLQGWAELPAALLGLWFAGRRAVAL
ncbi:MAG: cation transporter, partial [Janthinobacterium lividum]